MKNFTQVFICTHFLALLSSVFIVFISSTRLYSEEIVLQNGSEYNGCEDACISDDDGQNGQNTNFGDKIFLSLQDDYWATCFNQRILVKFDLRQFDKSTKVNEALLELYVESQPKSGSATTMLYSVSKKWEEMETTWFKATEKDWWDNDGGDFKSQGDALFNFSTNAARKWQKFDVTSLVQNFILNPDSNLGFLLYMSQTMAIIEFTSSESVNLSKRPTLTLDVETSIKNETSPATERVRISRRNNSYLIFVPFSKTYTVSIFNSAGRKLTSFVTAETNAWNKIPGSINAGIHFVHIRDRENNFNKKVWFVKWFYGFELFSEYLPLTQIW